MVDLNYFNPTTDPRLFHCGCGSCNVKLKDDYLQRLDYAREQAGVPFVVTSGPRCEEYNDAIGGSENSDHINREGADIACDSSAQRFMIVGGALAAGFTRIGIAKDFVHLGVSDENPNHVIWVYD